MYTDCIISKSTKHTESPLHCMLQKILSETILCSDHMDNFLCQPKTVRPPSASLPLAMSLLAPWAGSANGLYLHIHLSVE